MISERLQSTRHVYGGYFKRQARPLVDRALTRQQAPTQTLSSAVSRNKPSAQRKRGELRPRPWTRPRRLRTIARRLRHSRTRRGRERPRGPLTINRHQRGPLLPLEKLSRRVRGVWTKNLAVWQSPSAPETANLRTSYLPAAVPANISHLCERPRRTTARHCASCLAPRASRGRKHSKGNTLAEELPRTHANDARAPHTSPARAAATPPRALRQAKARKPTTSPTAFNRLTRQNRAGPLPHEAGRPRPS